MSLQVPYKSLGHCLGGSEYLGHMASHLNATPLLLENAFAVKEEGAAVNASNLFAVHIFHFDDIKDRAQFFFGIGNQFKRET
jgi:hypothetical protein